MRGKTLQQLINNPHSNEGKICKQKQGLDKVSKKIQNLTRQGHGTKAWEFLAKWRLGAGTQDKTNWQRQRETQTRYRHGNGEQVDTIRVGKMIRLVGETQGEVARYLKWEERTSIKTKQGTMRQHIHKTTKHNQLSWPWRILHRIFSKVNYCHVFQHITYIRT